VPHLWPQANARSSQFHPVVQVSTAALLLKRDQVYPIHCYTLLVLLPTRRKKGPRFPCSCPQTWRKTVGLSLTGPLPKLTLSFRPMIALYHRRLAQFNNELTSRSECQIALHRPGLTTAPLAFTKTEKVSEWTFKSLF
jgi:hypothetical protein